jgi:hypothetical protein
VPIPDLTSNASVTRRAAQAGDGRPSTMRCRFARTTCGVLERTPVPGCCLAHTIHLDIAAIHGRSNPLPIKEFR